MENKEIGGFLELELNDLGSLYHDKAVAVNTGRNALEYILKTNEYSKIYLPYFTCEATLEPLRKLDIAYSFYNIDNELRPIFDFTTIKKNEGFIYPNYFGLCNSIVEQLILKCERLILDNAQAFFYQPKKSTPSFYSPRKFFGVSDGGFLYNEIKLNIKLERDSSLKRLTHITGRLEQDAENFYTHYQLTEISLQDEPIKKMSKFTEKILSTVDYDEVKNKRQQNYGSLHREFCSVNKLKLLVLKDEVPLCYPLLLTNGSDIKQKLIDNKIYVPTYWPNVLEWTTPNSFEYNLTKNLLCLPLDQRYGNLEMLKIINVLKSFNE
ncbi:hypothetical protein [Aequorivita capsosiphonis]|uniref:hypothetical protein n=1 Tax=Aequorivita capsosiphonis TaxID=487317 RepID=UPI000414E609|nr:hypothetical protein [Aequorivita capsosiphonis]